MNSALTISVSKGEVSCIAAGFLTCCLIEAGKVLKIFLDFGIIYYIILSRLQRR